MVVSVTVTGCWSLWVFPHPFFASNPTKLEDKMDYYPFEELGLVTRGCGGEL
jgi:hypothetical protein